MIGTIQLVLLTAFRDRFFSGLAGLLLVAFALSFFFGSTALAEKLQMSVVFAAGAARLVLILGLTVLVSFHIQRMFEMREVEAILSRAISREGFVVAYWCGFSTIAFLFVALVTGALAFLAPEPAGALHWGVTALTEALVMIAVTVFAGTMLERATSTVMFALGFYALARLIGYFIGIVAANDAFEGLKVVDYVVYGISFFVPRLDLFAQTEWLIYGVPHDVSLAPIIQALVFLALVLSAGMFDLRRKQF